MHEHETSSNSMQPSFSHPAQAVPPEPRNQGLPKSFWVALVLLVMLSFSVLMNFGMMLALAGSTAVRQGNKEFSETLVEGTGDKKIVVIDIEGVIINQKMGLFGGGMSMVDKAVLQLRQAAADTDVAAIVLKVDSPGGGVTASDVIWNEVNKARTAGKKVVAHMGDICASGGYYISAPADHIVASPTTITGSIGVIMSHVNMQELLEHKLGIKATPIKSGEFKDIGSSERPMTESERKILQDLIDEMYERFVDIIVQGRDGKQTFEGGSEDTRSKIKLLADGRIYTGKQAAENGLVDSIGYVQDAIEHARKLSGLSSARIVKYTSTPSFFDALMGEVRGGININSGIQVDASDLTRHLIPRLEYRWVP